jgi:hypothetical protein
VDGGLLCCGRSGGILRGDRGTLGGTRRIRIRRGWGFGLARIQVVGGNL